MCHLQPRCGKNRKEETRCGKNRKDKIRIMVLRIKWMRANRGKNHARAAFGVDPILHSRAASESTQSK